MTRRSGWGFTLVELLVVLTIMGLVLTLALPRLDAMDDGHESESSARDLAGVLMEARSTAIRENRQIAVTIDRRAKVFQSSANEVQRSFEGIRAVDMRLAPLESVSEAVGHIRFYPDGTSSGGTIVLAGEADDYKVAVDWFTGRVKIEKAQRP